MGDYRLILQRGNLVAGSWRNHGAHRLRVVDKYDGQTLAELPLADEALMEEAISKAFSSKHTHLQIPAGTRESCLQKLATLLESKYADFVDLIVRESGKPIGNARAEVDRGVRTLRLAAAESLRFCGEIIPMDFGAGAGKTAFTKRIPVGVVVGITPFNFPLNLVLHKVAPALAVGCPIIIKPAPQAPLTALALAALVQEAGFAAGALQVLLCENALAERLVTDPRIAMLSFTGSDAVGWRLRAIAGKKKVALELGGNAAVIVDETTDLPTAAKAVCIGAYSYAGQTCISTQRVFVVEAVFARFQQLLIDEIEQIKSGNPHDENVVNGPIIDAGHLDRIDAWVHEAIAGGAQVLAGGKILSQTHHIFAPTLLTQTDPSMKVCHDEVFGPVAVLEKVSDFEMAVDKVNESRYGLQVGVFTNCIDRVKWAHSHLEVGGVIINGAPGFRVDNMPYGGIKDSGAGREGVRYAMEEMTEPRLLVY